MADKRRDGRSVPAQRLDNRSKNGTRGSGELRQENHEAQINSRVAKRKISLAPPTCWKRASGKAYIEVLCSGRG